MLKTLVLLVGLAGCAAGAQTPEPPQAAPQPPNYSNFSILLVNPAGGAVVLMHNPKNELEYVDVAKSKEAFAAGYVPLRTAEISELIMGLDAEVIRLRAEIERLKQAQAQMSGQPVYAQAPSPVDVAAQQRNQAAAERAERRQQLLQAWIMLQSMNRSQPYQLPMPGAGRLKANCTTNTIGGTSYTNCD